MPPVGFEPTISAVERPQTYTFDRAANGTGKTPHLVSPNRPLCTLPLTLQGDNSVTFPLVIGRTTIWFYFRQLTNFNCHKIRLTLRLLMSYIYTYTYIYIYIYIYIYMEHLFLMFLDHTQRRSTVCRTPLDE